MQEKFSEFFCHDITPENDWTGSFRLIIGAEYKNNNGYLYLDTSGEIWTKDEAEKFAGLCIGFGVKSAITKANESVFREDYLAR